MSDQMSKVLGLVGILLVLAACVVVVVAHRTTGWMQVGEMVAALAVVIGVLGAYNHCVR